ncbi:MAG: MFS transporter, partial [Gemmatimonadota bacterium]
MTDPVPARSRAPWYLLGVLTLAYTFSFIDRQILNLLVAPIRRDLALTDFDMSLLQGFAFAIFYTLLGIPLGRLADRTDRRRLVAAGIALWSIMTVVCGAARTYGQLFVARIGVGVGEAALSPAAYSLIADSFPRERLGRAASIYNFGVHFGSALALIVGGAIVQQVSGPGLIDLPLIGQIHRWQIVFWAVGLPGLLVALLALTIREPARAPRKESEQTSFREVVAHIADRRGFYAAHFIGFS